MRLLVLLAVLAVGGLSMGLFSWLSGGKEPEEHASAQPEQMPWDRHPSIYEFIQAHIKPGRPGLTEGAETLPDEQRMDTGKIRWAAGAMDGVFSHHVGGQEGDATQSMLMLLRAYCGSPTATNKKAVYDFLMTNSVLSFVDPLSDALRKETTLNLGRLDECVRSFATESPDREPVKFGICILGLFRHAEDRDVFLTLGRHDEFTLYAAVALANGSLKPEEDLWELAKNVDGWGRINTVERLANTDNPEIKEWLLREGYKNSVMYEYLAYTCAVTGNLTGALEREQVDDELLDGAGDIIEALIAGGPAQNIDDYEDAATAMDSFVQVMESRAKTLRHFLAVNSIKRFLGEKDADWAARSHRGWTEERRKELSERCDSILGRPIWIQLVIEDLKSSDNLEFYRADQAAQVLGVDTWTTHWNRLQESPLNSGNWYNVMRQCDEQRIDEIIALAERTLPLDKIETGAADEMGLGKGWEAHQCLDSILQDLGSYPGHGFRLVEAGLKSPVVRNRNMAIKAMSEWGKEKWPAGSKAILEQARAVEPEKDVRERIQNTLDGKPIDGGPEGSPEK
jgi:hypothetical protein